MLVQCGVRWRPSEPVVGTTPGMTGSRAGMKLPASAQRRSRHAKPPVPRYHQLHRVPALKMRAPPPPPPSPHSRFRSPTSSPRAGANRSRHRPPTHPSGSMSPYHTPCPRRVPSAPRRASISPPLDLIGRQNLQKSRCHPVATRPTLTSSSAPKRPTTRPRPGHPPHRLPREPRAAPLAVWACQHAYDAASASDPVPGPANATQRIK